MAAALDNAIRSTECKSTNSSTLSQIDTLDLRRVRDDIPKRLWLVASIAYWERAAFWGLTAPWQNYMQNPVPASHEDTSGALGLGQVKATRIYCAFYIGYYVSPLILAVLSDSHLGRYKTLLISLVFYTIGCAVLTVSSIPASLEKGWGLPGLLIAMVSLALGGGGFQSSMMAFLADQYTEDHPRIEMLKSGERVVTDHSLTLQYTYSLYYWLENAGSLSSFATISLEKNVNFTSAYGLTLCFLIFSLLTLVIGKRCYVRIPHTSDVLPQAARVLMCASRNGFRLASAYPEHQLEHHHRAVAWSSQLVSELTLGLRACRVLLAFVMFYACFDQMQNNLISQAGQMETLGTPNDLLPAMNQVGCILGVPIVQHVLFPYLNKRNIYLKPIARITIGFGFMSMAMLYATIVQHVIYSTGPCFENPKRCGTSEELRRPNHINVWFQAPIYFLIALGEIFSLVTALEYAYSHAPKDMKALVQAISLLIAGAGSAFALGLTPVAHDPYLVIFYAGLASAMAVTALIFWLLFRNYDNECTLPKPLGGLRETQVEPEEDDELLKRNITYFSNLASPCNSGFTLVSTCEGDLEHGFKSPRLPESALEMKDSALTLVNPLESGRTAKESVGNTSMKDAKVHDPSEKNQFETPQDPPPFPPRWATESCLKETPSTDRELGGDIENSTRDDAIENQNPTHRYSTPGDLLQSRESSIYETASEDFILTDDEASVTYDNSHISSPSSQSPGIRTSADHAVPVPTLVAHFEGLSHENLRDAIQRPAPTLTKGYRRPSEGSIFALDLPTATFTVDL